MKPQMQRIVSNKNGDCFASCLASIMEIDNNTMPDFFANPNRAMTDQANEWLKQFNLELSYFKMGSYPPPQGYAILSVKSLVFEKCSHSVVWSGQAENGWGEIVHDPSPRGGEHPNEDWLGFHVLVVRDASKLVMGARV